MKKWTLLLIGIFTFGVLFPGESTAAPSADQILRDHPQTADQLLNQPSNVRTAIAEASKYPGVLSAMNREQNRSQTEFQKIIAPHPRKTQEKVYQVVRYPELLNELVYGGQKSKSQLNNIVKDYPKEVRQAALDLGQNDYALLQSIQTLYVQSDQQFDQSIRGLPPTGQEAFRTLLGYPEVLETMNENPGFTEALGQAYGANAGATLSTLEAYHQNISQKNQEAVADYQKTLKSDPQARQELQQSAQVFAKEYGYGDGSPQSYAAPSQSSQTIVNININPYPYWFGYPTWYPSAYWRPYPLWYHTGFYFGVGGALVSWGPPSYWYTQWFYRYPRNISRYPYLAGYYGNYYYRWRNRPIHTGFHRGVRHWHHQHRHTLNQDIWRYDRHRAKRWREYGQRVSHRPQRPVVHRGFRPGPKGHPHYQKPKHRPVYQRKAPPYAKKGPHQPHRAWKKKPSSRNWPRDVVQKKDPKKYAPRVHARPNPIKKGPSHYQGPPRRIAKKGREPVFKKPDQIRKGKNRPEPEYKKPVSKRPVEKSPKVYQPKPERRAASPKMNPKSRQEARKFKSTGNRSIRKSISRPSKSSSSRSSRRLSRR